MKKTTKVPTGPELVDPHYTRGNKAYQTMMDRVAADGYQCPFCTLAVHPKPILERVGNGTNHDWFITERHEVPNDVSLYFLIIPNRHIESFEEIRLNDFMSIHNLIEWAKTKYSFTGFGLVLRSGDSKVTGATVKHIHLHLIVPEIDENTGRAKPYYFPIG